MMLSKTQKPKAIRRLQQVGPHEWMFEHPRSMYRFDEQLDEGINLMHSGNPRRAERIFRDIIQACPGHFDAYHHLALILNWHGKNEEAFQLWENAVGIGKGCFPKKFSIGKDKLEWGWLENRPFLRAYEGLALALLAKGETEKALVIFNELLVLNPNDNQGARALVVDCNFKLKRPGEVLRVCDQYPDDIMPEIAYGRPLALFQLGEIKRAEEAMQPAIEYLPLIAKELVKERHRRPKSTAMPGYVTVGGADQAYEYWMSCGKYWEETEGAIEFVKECLKKYPPKSNS